MLENLYPQNVFGFFEEICAIPHGSRNTKAISDYCAEFARKRGLQFIQDEYNNVIITKNATEGYEDAPTIIIQGHLDMVCEKEDGCDIDFKKDGLRLYIDGDYVRAKGTTLGGDDGIAVAYALAVLDSDDISHPKLECIFTVDEEIGMLGAAAMDLSSITGNLLINIDSEEEGILTVSCAGGATVESSIPIKREYPVNGETAGDCAHEYKDSSEYVKCGIKVSGLTGGHSGAEIHKERANAIQLLARLMHEVNLKSGIRLYSIDGGLKDNAIPVTALCSFAVPKDKYDTVRSIAEKYNIIYKNEYMATDSGVEVSIYNIDAASPDSAGKTCYSAPMDRDSTDNVLFALFNMPDGVQAMSKDIEGLVETSLNSGILKTTDKCVELSVSVRSSVNTRKEMLISKVGSIIRKAGGNSSVEGSYTPWEYKKDSGLRNLMSDVYEKQYGEKPQIAAIHAGLECGVLSQKIKNLDCVSFGPNMHDIHTFKERLSISSVQRCYKYLLEILRRAGEL